MEEGRHTANAGFEQSNSLLCSLWLVDSYRQMHRTEISKYGKKPKQLYYNSITTLLLYPPSQELDYAQKYEAICFWHRSKSYIKQFGLCQVST